MTPFLHLKSLPVDSDRHENLLKNQSSCLHLKAKEWKRHVLPWEVQLTKEYPPFLSGKIHLLSNKLSGLILVVIIVDAHGLAWLGGRVDRSSG